MFRFEEGELYHNDVRIMFSSVNYVYVGNMKYKFGINCTRGCAPYFNIHYFGYESQIPIYNRLNELMDTVGKGEISDDLCEYVLHLYEFARYFYDLVSKTIFDFGSSNPVSKLILTKYEKGKIEVKNNVIYFFEQEFKISDEFQSLIENGLDVMTATESIHDQIEWMLRTPSAKSARNRIIN